jgi:hypothetical protein
MERTDVRCYGGGAGFGLLISRRQAQQAMAKFRNAGRSQGLLLKMGPVRAYVMTPLASFRTFKAHGTIIFSPPIAIRHPAFRWL